MVDMSIIVRAIGRNNCFQNIYYRHGQKIYSIFRNTFHTMTNDIVLDVGGVSNGFESLGSHCFCVSVNITLNAKKSGWDFILADARYLPFQDNSINYVVSNSIIEHIEDGAVAYSSEIKRITKNGYFVTCPSRKVLLEPHFFVPLIQFAPEKLKRFVVCKLGLTLGYFKKGEYEVIQIPTTDYLKALFKGADFGEIKLSGFPWDNLICKKILD